MELAKLRLYFETSPAMRLLRSPNAPYVVDFLHQQFKRSGKIAVASSDLQGALSSYQETIQEFEPDVLRDKAETYLSHWCSNETRWLHRFIDAAKSEALFQLTSHSEDVLTFLDQVLDRDLGFVGTDSRLRLVIETLSDLVVGASNDPEARLIHLRAEKLQLEKEIERIEREGTVTPYQPAQIRERFATAVSLLKQLQGDFRAVEEKFKGITQQVQQRQHAGLDSRGGILEFVLDAEDVLKQEDQGVSFYEFVRFILSPTQQDKLQSVIQQLGHLQELMEQAEGLETVRRMVPLLLAEAEKVMRTNQRLSATLRRLLDSRAHRERQRISQLLKEIRGLAAGLTDEKSQQTVGLEVDTKIVVSSPFSKTFWNEPPRFETIDLTEHVPDDAHRAQVFQSLAEMQRLDWRAMKNKINDVVEQQGSATLGQLLAEHPPRSGVIEVLGYLQIARDDGHDVRTDSVEEITLPPRKIGERPLLVVLPLVTFVVT